MQDRPGRDDRRPARHASGYPQIAGLVVACALILGIVVAMSIGGGAGEPLAPILLATGEWAPYSGEALGSKGVASAVVSAVLQQMGYQPEFRFMPWARAEQAALENDTNGGVRATFPYALSTEREAGFYYSKPIFSIELSVFYNARRHPGVAQITTAADLSRVVIVPVSGYRYPPDVEAHLGAEPLAESNLAAFTQLLESERPLVVVEATRVGDELLAGPLAARAGAIATAPLHFTSSIHLIASKRNPNNNSFIRDFDAALTELQQADALKAIETQALESIDDQRMVHLQPLDRPGSIEAFTDAASSRAVLLPRGTRAVVERWSSNYLEAKPVPAGASELVRVRILNGPQRGQQLFVDERTIVLP